ncbi:MAG: peptidylprolyl isomerase, partial [Phycisphaerales bacterium]
MSTRTVSIPRSLGAAFALILVAAGLDARATDVVLQTTMGDIRIQLYDAESPITVANFLQYVNEGFFDGEDGLGATIFHRVIPGFVAQGGGHRVDMSQKDTHDPIVNEASNGLSNLR